MKNLLRKLLSVRIVPTYRVLYAPHNSRHPEMVFQNYTVLGNPQKMGWKSKAGHKLFTAKTTSGKFVAFRSDRVLSVNFAGLTLASV